MSVLPTRDLTTRGRIKRNSYYHERKPYSQNELDEMRISEGYSKELRIRFTGRKGENQDD